MRLPMGHNRCSSFGAIHLTREAACACAILSPIAFRGWWHAELILTILDGAPEILRSGPLLNSVTIQVAIWENGPQPIITTTAVSQNGP
jgi:hypothetical protein